MIKLKTAENMPVFAPPPLSALFSFILGASAILAAVSALRRCEPELASKMVTEMRPCWEPFLSPQHHPSCADGIGTCVKNAALACTYGCAALSA